MKAHCHIASIIIPFMVGLGVFAGFVKELVIAYIFGASQDVDVFRVASYLPNAFFQSLAVVFVGLYLPAAHERKRRDIIYGAHYILKFSTVMSALGVIFCSYQADLLAPGFSSELKEQLSNGIAMCWVAFFLGSLTFQMRIVFQNEERRYIVASMTLANHLLFLAALFFLVMIYPQSNRILSEAFLLALLGVFLVNFLFYREKGVVKELFHSLVRIGPSQQSFVLVSTFLMAISYHIVLSLSRVVERYFLSSSDIGAIACLDYAYSIYTAIAMLVGTSLIILFAKQISLMSHKIDPLRNILRIIALPVVGTTTLALFGLFFGQEIVELVYLRGQFSLSNVEQTSQFLVFISPALPIAIMNMVFAQLLLSLGKTNILLMAVIFKLLVKIVSMYFLYDFGQHLSVGISLILSEAIVLLIFLGFLSNKKQRELPNQ